MITTRTTTGRKEETMDRFWATFEPTTKTEGIVTLSLNGEWAGSGLVRIRRASAFDLREEAYRIASQNAAAKGGILDRFVEGRA